MADPLSALPDGFSVDGPAPHPAVQALPDGYTVDQTPQMTGYGRQPAIFGSGMAKGGLGFLDLLNRGASMSAAAGSGMPFDQKDFTPDAFTAATGLGRQIGAVDRPDLQPQNQGEKTVAAAGEGAGATLPLAALGGVPGLAYGAATGAAGGAAGETAANAFPEHPDLARAGGNLLGGMSFFGILKALGRGLGPLSESVARTILPGATERQGADAVTAAMKNDMAGGGPGPAEIAQRLADAQARGTPLAIADAAGENTQGMLGRIYRQPGPARQDIRNTLESRDAGAGERTIGAVDNALTGGEWTDPAEIIAGQKAAAAPAYATAFAKPAWSPRLQQFLDDPVMKQGMNQGMKMERLEAVAENRPFDPTSLGVDFDAQGNVTLSKTPNMRVLDAGKRGLDGMIEATRDPIKGTLSPEGRSLSIFRDAYLKELDGLNPDYSTARAAFSGPAQSMAAIRAGANSLNLAPTEAAAQLGKLSSGDAALFRQGASGAYANQIGNTSLGGNEALNVMGSATKQQRLLALAKDNDSYNEVMKHLADEKAMFDTKTRTMGNSATAGRLAEDTAGSSHGGGSLPALAANALLHGEPGTGSALLAVRYLSQVFGRSPSLSPEVNSAATRLLMSQSPETFAGLTARLRQSPGISANASVPVGLLGRLTNENQ